jgi:TatD DNase family protein
LEIAKRLGKPVVIHCRAAYDDLYEILREMKGNEREGRELRGAVHFFTGSFENGKKLLELGFYIAFPGIITYARDYDKVIKYAPLDRILVETDAPYAVPEPFRGQRNEPRYVKYVAEKLAELKGLTSEEIVEVTTANAKTLFQI